MNSKDSEGLVFELFMLLTSDGVLYSHCTVGSDWTGGWSGSEHERKPEESGEVVLVMVYGLAFDEVAEAARLDASGQSAVNPSSRATFFPRISAISSGAMTYVIGTVSRHHRSFVHNGQGSHNAYNAESPVTTCSPAARHLYLCTSSPLNQTLSHNYRHLCLSTLARMLAPAVLLGIRGVQLVLSIIVMGLVAYRKSLFFAPCPTFLILL